MRTLRQQIVDLLNQRERSARDLSQALGIREKEVYEHLKHVALTVSAQGKKLVLHPSRCLSCGYVFKNRTRLTIPSGCPRCRNPRIQEPIYSID